MRAAVVLVFALAACGGSTPPPETPPTDTSSDTASLETNSAASKDSTGGSPAASSTPASPPATAPAADDSAAAAPAPFHPTPSTTGAIDGKPFVPRVAQVLSPMKKDGRIALSLTEETECPAAGDAKADHPALMLLVPWLDGYKVDLAALRPSGKKGPPEIAFSHGKKGVSTTFKPSGMVTVVSAPADKGATGKLKIDLQSGDYMLAGTLDVEVCVSPK